MGGEFAVQAVARIRLDQIAVDVCPELADNRRVGRGLIDTRDGGVAASRKLEGTGSCQFLLKSSLG